MKLDELQLFRQIALGQSVQQAGGFIAATGYINPLAGSKEIDNVLHNLSVIAFSRLFIAGTRFKTVK